MKRLLLLLLFFFPYQLLSQSKVDSLQLEYSKATEDTVRVKILNELAVHQAKESPEDAKNSVVEALKLVLRTDNDRLKITSYNHYAAFLLTQSMEDSAVATFNQGLDLAKKINFLEGQSDALIGLGSSYWRKGDFERAHAYSERNIELAGEMNDQFRVANSYMVQGSIYTQNLEYAKAMERYTLASGIYKELDKMRRYVMALGNIGFVQRNLDNYENAKTYFLTADSIAEVLDFPSSRAFSAYNLSIIYRKTGDLERAIASNSEAIKIYQRLGDRKRVAFGERTMGKIYWEMEQYETALDYFKKALEISIQVDDSVNIGHTYEEIGDCYHQLKENRKAKEYLLKARDVALGLKLDVLSMDVHQTLSKIYAEERNFEKAYDNMANYGVLRDSLYTKEKRELGTEIEAKYQNEQKAKEIALLAKDNDLQALNLTKRVNERNAIIAFSIVILLLAGLLYNQYRVKQKANRKLKELDRLKSNFFANISHEFRTPLTLIKGPIERLEQDPDTSLSLDTVKMIRRNTTRVLKLVNQLLDLSRIDEGSLKLEPTEGDVYQSLRGIASSFNSHAAQRRIDYRVRIPQVALWTSFDRDKLEKIAYNLLSNAFKFSEDGAVISFLASFDERGLQLIVSDSGKGIPKENLPFIFDRFYQVDGGTTRENEGSGIGLSLSKDLVELMDGTITVSSDLGKGSSFKVHLPFIEIKTGSEVGDELTSAFTSGQELTEFQEHTSADQRDVPSVLLVEDNEDMRFYIREQLIQTYRVEEATDGLKGMEIARIDPPDLIITDLMMPKMDGLELCKKLKTDILTSHIPVIMLTAKAGMQNKLKGLETGADDYITKPFDAKEVLVRTKNLIDQRQKLRELYSDKEIQIDPRKITVTSLDQKFLEEALALLEEKHGEGNFGVPQMQEALGMSKSQLHRKLKALTNKAPGELLRNFRLKRAAQLLSQKADTVTQVAYRVGFNDLSYFTRCFKELFGVVPSAYSNS